MDLVNLLVPSFQTLTKLKTQGAVLQSRHTLVNVQPEAAKLIGLGLNFWHIDAVRRREITAKLIYTLTYFGSTAACSFHRFVSCSDESARQDFGDAGPLNSTDSCHVGLVSSTPKTQKPD
jgi:hypothetical protein